MKHCICAVESCPTSAEHIHCSIQSSSLSKRYPKGIFSPVSTGLVGRHLAKRDPDFTQWNRKENNLSIDLSRCKSICKFPPPFYWPSWPLHPFLFLQSSPPPVLSFPRSSQLPLSSPICRWSCRRTESGPERKGTIEGGQTCRSAWTGLNNYHASLCAPTKE